MTANDTTTATAKCVVRSLWVLPTMSVQRNLRLECKVDHKADHRRSQSAPFGPTAPRDPEFLNIHGTRQDAADRSHDTDALIVLPKLEC